MTTRRTALIALVFALLVQAGFIATYHWHTNGCFCRFTGFPEPRPLPDHLSWLLSISSLPLGRMTIPAEVSLPGYFYAVEAWAGALLYAGINAFFWFDVAFFALTGLVLLCRVRIESTPGSRIPIHLADRSAVRAHTVAAIPLALVVVGMASGAVHRRAWMAEAERVLNASFIAVRTDGADPAGVNLSMYVEPAEFAPSQLAGPYEMRELRDRRTRYLDRFVPSRGWAGLVRFSSGSVYEFAVWREGAAWEVYISPPRFSRSLEPIR